MRIFVITPPRTPVFAHLADSKTIEEIACGKLFALGAVSDDSASPEAVGLLCCRLEEGIAEITWIYVEEAFRKQSCATKLIWQLLDLLVREPSISEVSAVFTRSERTEPLRSLLEGIGFADQTVPGAACYEARIAELSELPELASKQTGRLLPLSSAPALSLKSLNHRLLDAPCAVSLPIRAQDFHSASRVCLEGGSIIGALLIRQISEREVYVPWIYAAPGKSRVLPSLLSEVAPCLLKEFSPDTRLTTGTVGQASAALFERLLPGAQRYELCAMSLDLADGLLSEEE